MFLPYVDTSTYRVPSILPSYLPQKNFCSFNQALIPGLSRSTQFILALIPTMASSKTFLCFSYDCIKSCQLTLYLPRPQYHYPRNPNRRIRLPWPCAGPGPDPARPRSDQARRKRALLVPGEMVPAQCAASSSRRSRGRVELAALELGRVCQGAGWGSCGGVVYRELHGWLVEQGAAGRGGGLCGLG